MTLGAIGIYPQGGLALLRRSEGQTTVLRMAGIRIGVLDAYALGYPDLDLNSALEANPRLHVKLLPILVAIQSEWPHVRMPQQFQAMHGDMAGFFEIRMQDGRENFRVFLKPVQLKEDFLLLLASGTKSRRTGFPSSFYSTVRALAGEFAASEHPLALFEEIT